MRIISILIVLVVIAYLVMQNMGVDKSGSEETVKAQSKEMMEQATQSVDQLNSVLAKQKEALEKQSQ